MNHKPVFVVGAAGIVVVAWSVAAGYRFGQQEVIEASNGPLWIMPESLSLGSIPAQERFAWNVTLVNRNPQPVEVKDLRASCSCTTLEPKKFVVPPGGQQLVKLEVGLLAAIQGNRPNESGERGFRVLLLPSIEGYPPLKGWELKGSVHYLYRCSPESVEFGTIIHGDAFPERQLDVRCDRPLASLDAGADPLLRATTEGTSSSFRVQVSFAGDQPLAVR